MTHHDIAPSEQATPISTYRLQISARFTLDDAADQVPYLAALGVGALYLSPILRSAAGSEHGYDTVDHAVVDPDRGGPEGLARLADACHHAGLGLVVDVVPNHMGVADPSQNQAWWELLRSGRTGWAAAWFDVDWDAGQGKVLLPVLADDVDLTRDLVVADGELRYLQHRFPLTPGSGSAHEPMADVLARQNYELANFRRADTDLNYRRFFAVSELAGVRVEDDTVHDTTHREILRWVTDHGVSGLRIDHPDGLAAPGRYLDRLASSAPGTWIIVEKILQPGEELLESWPVAGTTGYDALAEVNGVLVDPAGAEELDRVYRRLTGDGRTWKEHVTAGKAQVATTILRSEPARLSRLTSEPRATEAITALAVAFDAYRSYAPAGLDRLFRAAESAVDRHPDLAPTIHTLLPRLGDPSDELCVRFQQLTSAVAAKGVEDTAYYRYTRFLGANEVGGDPGTIGLGLNDFHTAQSRRMERAPSGMTTLSTHDTKRGEDLRARLAVLAESSAEWEAVARLLLVEAPVPDRAFGYLLWQTVVSSGLIERTRLHAFAEKAMREAAEHTGWIDPDPAFEGSVHDAVDLVYDRPDLRKSVEAFAAKLARWGWPTSLSQKLVQLTMPGVPDVYQGSEWIEDSLVDPDNRRPVDFTTRAAALADRVNSGSGPERADSPEAKQWVTYCALHARRNRPELFSTYQALRAEGPADLHLIAFDRGGAVTVATRMPRTLDRAGGWRNTKLSLPSGQYREVLTGDSVAGTVALCELLDRYPAALLLLEDDLPKEER